jgi:hypothetical protein
VRRGEHVEDPVADREDERERDPLALLLPQLAEPSSAMSSSRTATAPECSTLFAT